MLPNALLYPFRVLFSSHFNDEQLSSFITGALTVGLVWLLSALHNCVPDKFTREWTFRNDDDCSDIDDDDDLSFVDPWNDPFTYVSTQQRRMMKSSISTMVDIQKNIGELPKRLKRKHWPWETIRRKVMGEETENEGEWDDTSAPSHKVDDSISAATATKEKKDDNFEAVHSGGATADGQTPKNGHSDVNTSNFEVSDTAGMAKKDEKQLCIGSIFGLDVGGTLAKLVYFEKKTPENDTLAIWKLREKEYVRSASAKTVLMARMHTHTNNTTKRFTPKRSTSLSVLELSVQHDRQKTEALNRFYDFARRLDSHEDSIRDIQLSFYCRELGGEFHFISFETRKMQNAMDIIRFNNLHMNIRNMGATGGGAHKFADIWEQDLGIGMIKQDELNSLVAGMQFVLSTVVGECFTFRPKEDRIVDESVLTEENETESKMHVQQNDSELNPKTILPKSDSGLKKKNKIYKLDRWTRKVQRDTFSYSEAYPYMLVTIGTGVSVLRVDGPRKHERVSGSTIGGGTFWGLMRLLTDVENFEEAMKLAEKGDPTKVDMMVGDIYGEDSNALDKLGLAADIVASSFGKLVSKEDPAMGLTQEDLARALLSLVTNNIGQVAYLNAKLHNTPRIYFVGSFLRHNMISQRRLSYAIDYWSKGEMEALFLEHEGYFGALGAFLMTQNIGSKGNGFFQWKDNH